ncbi:hypothetical protein Egran_04843 [Elaphomyces granulatus]|uniref:Ubiquitin interaction motif protein n=1 Tax=Elaphomyces granulatus TaxID=519963 RepID=A0A232LTE3_9EURO|nr:hypothetical protein Egran_04843 [Elaphomyces granulatus]
MTSEPTEEAISNFVSFTSTSREQAISFLRANDLDSRKAINAYFENPAGPQPELHHWGYSADSTTYNNYGNQNTPLIRTDNTNTLPDTGYTAPPSRPPSRVESTNMSQYTQRLQQPWANISVNTGQGMNFTDHEERDMQQAVAMSLNPNFGPQESGVTSTNNTHFGRATRDSYDEGVWAVTLFNPTTREVVISPNPQDRRRIDGEPAFLRMSQEYQYLGGLLTILHSIPLAREALLLRPRVLRDYGHDPQWWNGQPINLPKVMSLEGTDTDWDDILYESQRLMAFLDSTERAFGSPDALASVKSMSGHVSDGGVSKFLESWQDAAVRTTPENQLAMIFTSQAFKRPFSELDPPIEKEFFILESKEVELDHGQTLYDVLDRTVWSDRPGEELDDVWLEHVAEVLTIKLETSDPSAKSVDVKIPAVLYPDRYLASCRDISREFRSRRLEALKEISKLDNILRRISVPGPLVHKGSTSRVTLEKAAAAAFLALPKNLANGVSDGALTPEAANAEGERLANELRSISAKIESKIHELEARKQAAREPLRSHSKALTEPSASPSEPPHCKYTLRGVLTMPHVTYVLRRRVVDNWPDEMDQDSGKSNKWQWWRISFSPEDAKTQLAEQKAIYKKYTVPRDADVAGYTARKVREIEVLRAAREESNKVILVYANNNALSIAEDDAPPPLQEFVNADNRAFRSECEESRLESEHASQEEASQTQDQMSNWNNSEPLNKSLISNDSFYNSILPLSTTGPQDSCQDAPTESWDSTATVNVFDYEVGSFNGGNEDQEMEERSGGTSFGNDSAV